MSLNATYKGMTLENIVVGYRISACLRPGQGFGNEFFVYLEIERRARDKLEFLETLDTEDVSQPKAVRSNLILDGEGAGGSREGPKHQFDDIDLISTYLRSTQNSRRRILEFRYDPQVIGGSENPVTIENAWVDKLEHGRLGDGYKITVGTRSDNAIGLSVRQAAQGSQAIRAVWYNNNEDGFLKKVVERRQAWSDLVVTIGNEEGIELRQDNLQRIYVDHSYGTMLDAPLPSLQDMTKRHSERSLARLSVPDICPAQQLIATDDDGDERPHGSYVVETATFVFNFPHYGQREFN